MNIDRIKITKEFNYHGFSEWIGLEASLDEGENVEDAILKARDQVIAVFNKTIPQVQPKDNGTIKVQTDVEFEKLKKQLVKFSNLEDAQAFLDTTSFKMAVQAKQIVNSKPPKHK